MLLEIAIGDAYGAGFEYVNERMIREKNDLAGYVQHPRHGVRPGAYTDDTQMSVAIAEVMLSGEAWTPEVLAGAFVTAFRRDPREGYAGAFYQFLQGVQDGREFVARIRPASEKSGAAMRAGPIGLYPSIDEVLERARVQAALTHDTPAGIQAAQAAALMTHYCYGRLGPRRELGEFLATHVPGPWTTPWRGKVGHLGVMSVAAAVTAVQQFDRLSDLLRGCVDYGGDVDTVAALALAAGSCCAEVEQDLPPHLHAGLERGAFGYGYLLDLDRRLLRWAADQRAGPPRG